MFTSPQYHYQIYATLHTMEIIDPLVAFAPYITLAGFVVGLGAVTVIDLLGFLGRHSSYWTEATIRTHKVTKPLIWIGLLLVLFGGWLLFYSLSFPPITIIFFSILGILLLNGLFLSLLVSPYLLTRERNGLATEPLPLSWQRSIAASFMISFTGWWTLFVLVVFTISS